MAGDTSIFTEHFLEDLEKKAGQKAARTIRRNLRTQLASLKDTGLMLKLTGAGVKMRYGQLEAIVVRSSKAAFIQHYGFEGIKKNGVSLKLPAQEHFTKLFDHTNALEKLADEIGELRLTKITNKIHF